MSQNSLEKAERVERLLSRLSAMETTRSPWNGTWQELCDLVLPRKGSFNSIALGPGKTGDERIFDSTAANALEILASSLGGLLTNPAMPWFDIRVPDTRSADQKDVREFLTKARDRMIRIFNSESTGFQTHVHELYLDIALLGTAVMYVESDHETVVRFSTRPLGEIFVSESSRGVVDTVFRRYELTARQAWQEWGDSCSEDVRNKLEDRPDDKVTILHAVFPRTDRDPLGFLSRDFPYGSVYLEVQSRHLLEESGYLEMPYMVPRWAKASGEIYGRGPGMTGLSDTRMLNSMSRTALMATEKMCDPPLMVPDDGFLGPVRSGPGGLSYYRAGSRDRIEALPVGANLAQSGRMMDQRRESIRSIYLNDRLQPDSGPAMTATEALIRQSEKLRLLGPVLGRLQTEFLSPLIKRVFNIMLRSGQLPPLPHGLKPSALRVDYTSPVAKAQKQYEAQSLAQAMEYLMPLVGGNDPFGIMDNFDTDRIARHATELFAVPGDYVRPKDEVDQRRTAKAGIDSAEIMALAGGTQ